MPVHTTDSEAQHWVVLLASFVTTSLTHGLATSFGVFYVEWHNEFPESSALVGWLSSSMFAMLLCFSPLAGALIKYFGVYPVVVAGSLLSFSGLLIASFTDKFFVLFITIPFMAGIGFGMSYTGVIVNISECFNKHYALANGIATTGASIGMVVLPIIFRFLIDQYGWRKALLIISALQANVVVCGRVMKLPQSRTRMRTHKKPLRDGKQNKIIATQNLSSGDYNQVSASDNSFQEVTCITNPSSRNSAIIKSTLDSECITVEDPQNIDDGTLMQERNCAHKVMSFLDHSGVSLIWTNRVYSSFTITTVTTSSIYGITLPFLVAQAKFVGISELEATLLISVIGFSNIVSRLTHGRLVDANVIQPAYIYIFVVGLSTIAAPIIAVVESYTAFVTCTALIGLSTGVFIPLQAVLIRSIVGKDRFPGGFAMGLVFVAVGNMTAAFLGGYLYDATGSYSAGFYFMGSMSGLCVALVLGLHFLWTRLVPDERWPSIH